MSFSSRSVGCNGPFLGGSGLCSESTCIVDDKGTANRRRSQTLTTIPLLFFFYRNPQQFSLHVTILRKGQPDLRSTLPNGSLRGCDQLIKHVFISTSSFPLLHRPHVRTFSNRNIRTQLGRIIIQKRTHKEVRIHESILNLMMRGGSYMFNFSYQVKHESSSMCCCLSKYNASSDRQT